MFQRKIKSFSNAQRIEGIKLADSIGIKEAAKQLDVNVWTLSGWVSRRAKYEIKETSSSIRIVPKRISNMHSSLTPNGTPAVTASVKDERKHVVISPNGFRIEGLTFLEAKELLK
jgi:hypothetical protein